MGGRAPTALAIIVSVLVLPTVAYQCESDINLGAVTKAPQKGMALDDTTFWQCTSRILSLWPNTDEKLTSLRFFKAWDPQWPESKRMPTWQKITDLVKANGMRVLLGTPVTCDEAADQQVWAWSKEFLAMLGPDYILGLAIGNEMELLHFKDKTATPDCFHRLWNPAVDGFWTRYSEIVKEFDDLGFKDARVTTSFGGAVLDGVPFVNTDTAMINSFLERATREYGDRFAFTFNPYPYFEPTFGLDPGTNQCNEALGKSTCFEPSCYLPKLLKVVRERLTMLTGHGETVLWLGETGWSAPKASTLTVPIGACEAWSSNETLQTYYNGFLKWDLGIGDGKGPDHIFYFTMHDSINFAEKENFGLVSKCEDNVCKLHGSTFQAPSIVVADPEETAPTTTADSSPSPPPTSFNCQHMLVEDWTDTKKHWCCKHEQLGCGVGSASATGSSSYSFLNTLIVIGCLGLLVCAAVAAYWIRSASNQGYSSAIPQA
jgi:hypothetical protein